MPRRRGTIGQSDDSEPVAAGRLIFAKDSRKVRIAARLNQRGVGDRTGFVQSRISKIEIGKMPITIDNMAKPAHCVNVPL